MSSVYQDFIDEKIKAGLAPGLSAVVFDRNGLIFSGTSGVHTIAGQDTEAKPMRPETIHWVASCTKIAISLIVLQILEKKEAAQGLSLDSLDDHDALIKILPEFKLGGGHNVTKILEGYGSLGKDDKRELILRDSKSKVTLRHLLTHTAGLAYYWNHVNMVEYYKPSQGQAYGILPFVTGEISDFASPAVKEAGVEMDYSPVTDWLGQFAIRSTGKNLRALFQEYINKPLNISNSECDILLEKMGQSRDVSGVHVRGPDSDKGQPTFIKVPFEIHQPEDDEPASGKAFFASACVYSSPRAYAQILQACLVHDQRLLKESTWKLAEIDALQGRSVKMPRPLWKSGRPDLSYDIDEFAPSSDPSNGFSMNLLQTHVALSPTKSGRSVGSYSWAGLCNTYYFVDPSKGVGSIIGTQVLPFADPQLMKMKDEWEALVCSQSSS